MFRVCFISSSSASSVSVFGIFYFHPLLLHCLHYFSPSWIFHPHVERAEQERLLKVDRGSTNALQEPHNALNHPTKHYLSSIIDMSNAQILGRCDGNRIFFSLSKQCDINAHHCYWCNHLDKTIIDNIFWCSFVNFRTDGLRVLN